MEKSNTTEILDYLDKNYGWIQPAQRVVAAVLFWMGDNNVSEEDLANLLNVTKEDLREMLLLVNLKLSTIGRLEKVTGLKLFDLVATSKK